MKKKLLSLVLAGAMVASTSVSAFAATDTTTTGNATILDSEDSKDINIGITGNVLDEQGNTKPGTISVTVPTATTFSINAENGDLNSADMIITNSSTENIKVTAGGFEDPNGQEKINLVKKSVFEQDGHTATDNNRGTVWLRLTGGSKNLGLTSESNGSGNGKMYDNDYNTVQEASSNYEIGKITANGGTMTLRLEGKGGVTATDSNPKGSAIQDTFKLVLRISRDK